MKVEVVRWPQSVPSTSNKYYLFSSFQDVPLGIACACHLSTRCVAQNMTTTVNPNVIVHENCHSPEIHLDEKQYILRIQWNVHLLVLQWRLE